MSRMRVVLAGAALLLLALTAAQIAGLPPTQAAPNAQQQWTVSISPTSGPPGSVFTISTGVDATCTITPPGTQGFGTTITAFVAQTAAPGTTINISCVFEGETKTGTFTVTAPPTLVGPTPGPGIQPTEPPPDVCVLTTNGQPFINVRQLPSVYSGRVGSVNAGEQVPVTRRVSTGDPIYPVWNAVTLADGTSGYVAAAVSTVTGSACPPVEPWTGPVLPTPVVTPQPTLPPSCPYTIDDLNRLPELLREELLASGDWCEGLTRLLRRVDPPNIYMPEVFPYIEDTCEEQLPEFIAVLERFYSDISPVLFNDIEALLTGWLNDDDEATEPCEFARHIVEQQGLPEGFPIEHAIDAFPLTCNRDLTDSRLERVRGELSLSVTAHLNADNIESEFFHPNACNISIVVNHLNGEISGPPLDLYTYYMETCGASYGSAYLFTRHAIAHQLDIEGFLQAANSGNLDICDLDNEIAIIDSIAPGLPEPPLEFDDCGATAEERVAYRELAALYLTHPLTDAQRSRIAGATDACIALRDYMDTGYIPNTAPIRPPITPTTPTPTTTPIITATPETPTETPTETAEPTPDVTPDETTVPTLEITPTLTPTATGTAVSPSIFDWEWILDDNGPGAIAVFMVSSTLDSQADIWVLAKGEPWNLTESQNTDERFPVLGPLGHSLVYMVVEGYDPENPQAASVRSLRQMRLEYDPDTGFPRTLSLAIDKTDLANLQALGLRLLAEPIAYGPNGTELVVSMADSDGVQGLYTLDIYDINAVPEPVLLVENARNPAFTTDNRFMAFERDGVIMLRGLRSGSEQAISPAGRTCYAPSAVSTGIEVYFVCDEPDGLPELYVFNSVNETEEPQPVGIVVCLNENGDLPIAEAMPVDRYYAVCEGGGIRFIYSDEEDRPEAVFPPEREVPLLPNNPSLLGKLVTGFSWYRDFIEEIATIAEDGGSES